MATGSRGKKTRVFLLPGILGTIADDWEPHFEAINDAGFEPIGIDWPGHGHDTNYLDTFTLQTLVDHVLSKIDAIMEEPVLLWCYGVGGFVALELERQTPGRCAAIWMHATKFYLNDDDIESVRKVIDPDLLSPDRQEMLQKMHGDRWRELAKCNLDLFEDILEFGPTADELETIRMPVLVSVGDQDEFLPVEEVELLADELIGGEPAIIPGVRHSLRSTRSSLIIPVAEEFSRRVLVG